MTERHGDDLDEGRLVSLFRFEESWTSWEMHPAGEEVVCCLQGRMALHQELPGGGKQSYELGPGEYAINPRGAWHTADARSRWSRSSSRRGRETPHRPALTFVPDCAEIATGRLIARLILWR